MYKGKEIHLVARPVGTPEPSDFKWVDVSYGDIQDGEFLVKNIYLSVDPYMRGRMNDTKSYMKPFELNAPLEGAAIGQVIKSRNEAFKEGEYVHSFCGWRDYFISNGKQENQGRDIHVVTDENGSLSSILGILGMPGLTAYAGLLRVGELKKWETVYVSAAAGAVGSIAGRIAKQKNCRVIGSAGSDDKVNYLMNECGFDYAFNYRTSDLDTQLKKSAPDGIDVFFDNVGGEQLEVALSHMRQHGRVVCCGSISQYNATAKPKGPSNIWEVIVRELKMQGFHYFSHLDMQDDFNRDMGMWMRRGKIKNKETFYEGIENTVEAFLGLFSGGNLGKTIVKL